MDIKAIDKKYIAPTYGRYDVLFTRGEGSLLYDDSGKRYIDLGAGIAVNTFGVADPVWRDAVVAQLDALQHTSNLYFTAPQALLARELCERTGAGNVFFSNSGAEANECMIKAARKYASDKYGGERSAIITLVNSFHGRTVTTLAATGQESFHTHFHPFTPGFYHAAPGDMADMVAKIDAHNPCAVMLELIQGEGGVYALPADYVKKIERICAERDILLLLDEVQTGNGRTGELYAYMRYGISPDIVSTAKGLCGGLPFGATLFFDKTREVLTPGSHGSTFGGNPVCAAGALCVLSRIDGNLLREVREKGDFIARELSSAKGVKSVSGMGLMLGIETEKSAGELLRALLGRGVAVLTAKDRIRLLPALNIPFPLLCEAVAAIKEELSR